LKGGDNATKAAWKWLKLELNYYFYFKELRRDVMKTTKIFGTLVTILVLVLGLTTLATSSTPIPTVVGPIPVTPVSYPLTAANRQNLPIDLASYGYVEEEFIISGNANVYGWGTETDPNKVWVITPNAPYTTRILVRMPKHSKHFSGVRMPKHSKHFSGSVAVEIFNATLGYDFPYGGWSEYWQYILDNGWAWVGISISPQALTGMKNFDATRYASLSLANPLPPGQRCPPNSPYETGLKWDIISQVGALLKSQGPSNPLAGYGVEYVYATGATGGDLSLYVNAIHPLATLDDGKPVYDGYLIKSTGRAAKINDCAGQFDWYDSRNVVRAKDVPVIRMMTQGDITGSGATHPDKSCAYRRHDSDVSWDRFRLYEVAGSSISSSFARFSYSCQEDALKAGGRYVPTLLNDYDFRIDYFMKGALANLDLWVRKGTPPPRAERLAVWECFPNNNAYFATDEIGNVLGGVRNPYVDVPIAIYPQDGAPIPLSQEVLSELYPSHGSYVNQVNSHTRELVKECWISKDDAQEILKRATQAEIP
jgi:hypothetical protein